MDFTREPIIETVITPREGCKLVVRSSKSSGQEEYFVEALEVVSFGNSFFFRSLERPKSFLVPTTDYEVLEVREPRMALKNVGQERKIKIAGGREANKGKEQNKEDKEEKKEPQSDKKRERKRGRRRGRGAKTSSEEEQQTQQNQGESSSDAAPDVAAEETLEVIKSTASFASSLLPPPPTLISEQIQKYKQDDLYKDAFYQDKPSEEETSKETASEVPSEAQSEPEPVKEQSVEESAPSIEEVAEEQPVSFSEEEKGS